MFDHPSPDRLRSHIPQRAVSVGGHSTPDSRSLPHHRAGWHHAGRGQRDLFRGETAARHKQIRPIAGDQAPQRDLIGRRQLHLPIDDNYTYPLKA